MTEKQHKISSSELEKYKEERKRNTNPANKESSFLFFVIFNCIFIFLLVFFEIFGKNSDDVVYLVIIFIVAVGLKRYLSYKNRYQDIDTVFQEDIQESEEIKNSLFTYSNSPNYIALMAIAGIKKATSTSLLFSELDNIALPQNGDKYIIYDFNHKPLVELETISVEPFSFGDISEDKANLEGFKTKNEWKEFYQNLFNSYLEPIRFGITQEKLIVESGNSLRYRFLSQVNNGFGISNYKITDDFQIIFEKFKVTRIFALNYKEWLEFAEELLEDNRSTDPYIEPKNDANLLLQAITKRSKSAIFAFSETELSESELAELAEKLARRVKGEPMAYILGEKEFWSLPLKVSTATLIPRPDTERLVELALDFAYKRLENQKNLQILDLGTGTGAIALAMASELGDKADIIGVDFQLEAVKLAEENRQNLGFDNVRFLQSDWFKSLENQQFDLILSNPPYIDADDENLKVGDVRFEPLTALVADNQGLSDLQKIIENAPLYLKPKGALMLEHGWQQAEMVRNLFDLGLWETVETIQDYGGNDRVTQAVLKE